MILSPGNMGLTLNNKKQSLILLHIADSQGTVFLSERLAQSLFRALFICQFHNVVDRNIVVLSQNDCVG